MLAKQPDLQPQQLIDAVLADEEVVQGIIGAVRRGEVDGFNDLGRFRRKSHRGSRSEEQTLKYLGENLESLGFGWEEESNQCRFFNGFRFNWPVRVLHARGTHNPNATSFKLGRKGERTLELVNENRQRQLFEFVNATPTRPAMTIEDLVYNLWIVADSTTKGHLAIYLAYPTDLTRDWLRNWQSMTLVCNEVRLLWEGSLLEDVKEVTERPESKPIEKPLVQERDLGGLFGNLS